MKYNSLEELNKHWTLSKVEEVSSIEIPNYTDVNRQDKRTTVSRFTWTYVSFTLSNTLKITKSNQQREAIQNFIDFSKKLNKVFRQKN